jgi:hypothetical protein
MYLCLRPPKSYCVSESVSQIRKIRFRRLSPSYTLCQINAKTQTFFAELILILVNCQEYFRVNIQRVCVCFYWYVPLGYDLTRVFTVVMHFTQSPTYVHARTRMHIYTHMYSLSLSLSYTHTDTHTDEHFRKLLDSSMSLQVRQAKRPSSKLTRREKICVAQQRPGYEL